MNNNTVKIKGTEYEVEKLAKRFANFKKAVLKIINSNTSGKNLEEIIDFLTGLAIRWGLGDDRVIKTQKEIFVTYVNVTSINKKNKVNMVDELIELQGRF